MKRREVLKRAAALGTAGAIAGCVSSGNAPSGGAPADDGTTTGEATATETETETETPESDGEGTTAAEEGMSQDVSIGSSEIVESDGSCGSGNDASVSFEEGVIRVTGKIKAPDPCHRAELDEVTYDSSSGELSVAVTAIDEGGMCSQCLAAIEYEAEIRYEGPAPATVRVSHGTKAGTTEVATASK